jgi:hypothetical protein
MKANRSISANHLGDADAPDGDHTALFRIVVGAHPLDVAELEARLNELGTEGFSVDRLLERRKLADGGRADGFVLVKERWE